LISKRHLFIAFWCALLPAVLGLYPAPSHAAGGLLIIEDADSGERLREFPVEKGDAFTYRYHHSVYRIWVHHHYRITEDLRFILVRVLSDPVVLFSPYPGYLLPYDSGRPHASGMTAVPVMRVFEDLVIAVGDELTDKRLAVGDRRFSLRGFDPSLKTVRIYVTPIASRPGFDSGDKPIPTVPSPVPPLKSCTGSP